MFRRTPKDRFTANACLQQDGFLYTKISCSPAGEGSASELAKPETIIYEQHIMPRKPETDRAGLLIHPIIIRVDGATYRRLEKLLAESSCRSIGEVARKILARERINCFYRDASMNGPMEELALIRKELRSIGININQQTRYFNAVKSRAEKQFHSDRTVELLLKADARMERLFALISKLAEKWLQKS